MANILVTGGCAFANVAGSINWHKEGVVTVFFKVIMDGQLTLKILEA